MANTRNRPNTTRAVSMSGDLAVKIVAARSQVDWRRACMVGIAVVHSSQRLLAHYVGRSASSPNRQRAIRFATLLNVMTEASRASLTLSHSALSRYLRYDYPALITTHFLLRGALIFLP